MAFVRDIPEDRSSPEVDNVPSSAVWSLEPIESGPQSQTHRSAVFAIHDAKNMLTVLASNIEYLDIALSDGVVPADLPSTIDDLREGARRLAGLLREALTELRGGQRPVSRASAVPVYGVVAGVVERVRRPAEVSGVRIELDGRDDAFAHIEVELFERVLENLLDNALRFSPSGGDVQVTCRSVAGRAVVTVSDSGPGIPVAERETVFTSYQEARSGSDGHFGLGLAFCRAVARSAGGDIRVEERRGGGACFVLELA